MRPRLAAIVCGWCGCEPAEPCLLCQGRINELGEYADWLVNATKAAVFEINGAYVTLQWHMNSNLSVDERFLAIVQSFKDQAEDFKKQAKL